MTPLEHSEDSAPTSLSLPDEVLLEIVKRLEKNDLKRASLVNSKCRSICQPVLFTDLKLYTWKAEDREYADFERHLLLSYIDQTPSLLSHTRNLQIIGQDPVSSGNGYREDLDSSLFTILCACSKSLKSLSLCWVNLTAETTRGLSPLPTLRFPQLNRLALFESHMNATQAASTMFPQLRELAVTCDSEMDVPHSLTTLHIGCDDPGCENHNVFLRKVIEANPHVPIIRNIKHNPNDYIHSTGFEMPTHMDMLSSIGKHLPQLTTLSLPFDIDLLRRDSNGYDAEFALIERIETMTAKMTSLRHLQLDFNTTIFDCSFELYKNHFSRFLDSSRRALEPLSRLVTLCLGVKKVYYEGEYSAEILQERLLQRFHAMKYAQTFPALDLLCVQELVLDRDLSEWREVPEGVLCQISRRDHGIVEFDEHTLDSSAFGAFRQTFESSWPEAPPKL